MSMLPRWLQTLGHLDKIPELFHCAREIENWPALMLRFFNLPGATYPIEVRSRSGMHVTLEEFCDSLTVWEMFCRRQYSVPRSARTIIDLGANIGVFAIWAVRQAPQSHVFSLEPFPKTFDRLVANVRSHGLESRVTCLQMAVAADSTPRAMSIEPMGSSGRSLLASEETVTESIEVQTITLADLIADVLRRCGATRIDLLKMDIEGAEHEVLPGIDPSILAPIDLLEVEYHPGRPHERIFESLKRAGLHCVHEARAGHEMGVAHFRRMTDDKGPMTNDYLIRNSDRI